MKGLPGETSEKHEEALYSPDSVAVISLLLPPPGRTALLPSLATPATTPRAEGLEEGLLQAQQPQQGFSPHSHSGWGGTLLSRGSSPLPLPSVSAHPHCHFPGVHPGARGLTQRGPGRGVTLQLPRACPSL